MHAHPDDERRRAPARRPLRAEGVHTVLVTCTGGEAGEILNPAADTPEARADLRRRAPAELAESVRILGYADATCSATATRACPAPRPTPPRRFAAAPLDEAVERLVPIIRAERPQVLVTYGDDHSGYPHPDHIRIHEISVAAFDAAGDPDRFPDAGAPGSRSKLYYSGWSRARLQALHEAFLERGEESPYADWLASGTPRRPTGRSPPGSTSATSSRAAGRPARPRTQIDPDGVLDAPPGGGPREVFPWEEYCLARSLVDVAVPDGGSRTTSSPACGRRPGSAPAAR